ncbi:hypothetical protein ACRRTK_024413 [Alexandromys fortis]
MGPGVKFDELIHRTWYPVTVGLRVQRSIKSRLLMVAPVEAPEMGPTREIHTLRRMMMKAHLCLPGHTLSGPTLGCGFNGDSVSISMAGGPSPSTHSCAEQVAVRLVHGQVHKPTLPPAQSDLFTLLTADIFLLVLFEP